MTTGEASPATARRHAVHEAIRQAEARFDLLFREDGGVHVWAACRAEIARTLLAETRAPETHRSGAAEEGDLPAVDVYVQTTAVGDDARRNVRAYGCVHTQDPVRWLIDNGYRVLLLCDVADRLARHDRLLAVHSRQLRSLPAQGGRERAILPPEAVAFWAEVDAFFFDRLGVRAFGQRRIEERIADFHDALAAQRAFFSRIRPRLFMRTRHDPGAAQIVAARETGARTVDLQYRETGRFDPAWSFPQPGPDAGTIPCLADEFWSWGPAWTNPNWFPAASCDVRCIGRGDGDGARADRIEIALRSVLGGVVPRPQAREKAADPRRKGVRKLVARGNDWLAAAWSDAARLRYLPGTGFDRTEGPGGGALGDGTRSWTWPRPLWNLVFRRYWRDHPQRRYSLLFKALPLVEETGDDVAYARLAIELIALGSPAAYHRKKLLGTINRLKRAGRTDLYDKGLDALIGKALTETVPTMLHLFEPALAEGKEGPILDRFGLTRSDRRWREGAALLGAQNPTLDAIVGTTDRLVAAADAEFLDTRVSTADVDRLAAHLRRRIEAGDPFSMLRIGDGEVYGFDPAYIDPGVLAEDRAAREATWWGTTLDEARRARLREGFVRAVGQADLLAFPSSFRLLRDLPGALPVMHRPIERWQRTTRAHVVLFRELGRMLDDGSLDLAGKAVCDDRCHQQLFTPERLAWLLAGARHVVAVSCFSHHRLNRALGDGIIHDHVLLPPHRKVVEFVDDGPMREALMPDIMDELLARIDATVRPGSVALVAGGFAGKELIGRVRERGGIALDIGATADYWAGVKTRGELDFTAYA